MRYIKGTIHKQIFIKITMQNYLVVLLISIITYSISYGQTNCGIALPQDSTEWGLGLIMSPDGNYIQAENKDGIDLFFNWSQVNIPNDSSIPIKQEDIIYAGFYRPFFKVYEIRGTKFKVLSNTLKGGLWIEFDELIKKGSPFYTYHSFILAPDKLPERYQNVFRALSLGVNLFNSCLNLRKERSVDSEVVICIPNNTTDLEYSEVQIIENRDAWAYVKYQKLVQYEDHGGSGDGCHYKVVKEAYGWIKVIDEKGYPNIWFPLIEE